MSNDLTKLTDAELLKLKKKHEYEVAKYHNLQLAKKVQLNSAYGALGNEYFRFFDIRQAEAITLSGQFAIRWIANAVNKYLNFILETQDKDYIIAIDTDSIYVKMEGIVEKVYEGKVKPPTNKIIDVLDKFCSEKMEKVIDKSYAKMGRYINAFRQTMKMKRETIADMAIWTAKKRYIMNVHFDESVRYADPELKIMGIEAVKSSTPTVCRQKIKHALKLIMSGDEVALQKYVSAFKKEFRTLSADSVAFPRSVNGIDKWKDATLVYKSGTPIHVKGSIIYNNLLKAKKLTRRYPTIMEGDKIRFVYLLEPNPAQNKVIAMPDTLPKEFGLDSFVDYELQFQKTFLDPLSIILNSIGWSSEKQNVLDV